MWWACNTSLLMASFGLLLQNVLMIDAALCMVALAHLTWYIDVAAYLAVGKMPFGNINQENENDLNLLTKTKQNKTNIDKKNIENVYVFIATNKINNINRSRKLYVMGRSYMA